MDVARTRNRPPEKTGPTLSPASDSAEFIALSGPAALSVRHDDQGALGADQCALTPGTEYPNWWGVVIGW